MLGELMKRRFNAGIIWLFTVALAALASGCLNGRPGVEGRITGDVPDAVRMKLLLKEATSWMYQIQGLEEEEAVKALADTSYPLLVIEPGHNFKDFSYDTAGILKALRYTPAGRRRILLAYVDVGQAEDYRSYWRSGWKAPGKNRRGEPDFLVTVDPDGWSGNYPVAYWREEWKAVWIGEKGVVETLARMGFDGVYLDWVEAYDDDYVRIAAEEENVSPDIEMIEFVEQIGEAGERVNPGFLVVPQNAPFLIDSDPERYTAAIDALAVEDTWYHGKGDAEWDDPEAGDLKSRHDGEWSTDNRLKQYRKYLDRGLPVFSVDYCISRENAAYVYNAASRNGLIPLVTRAALSRLTETPVSEFTRPGR